jgi:SAM-dependent methyltransferase
MYVTSAENDPFANIMRLLAGLIDPLLSPLASLPAGAHVVQLGCGTGELSLALARRRPDLRISAIDIDPAALNDGRAHAAKDDLTVDFREMSMAELDFADDSVDAILSRMGLFLPGTAPFDVSAREAARVLRADGILSIAIWADLADSPYIAIGLSVLRKILPEGALPDMEAHFAEASRPALLGKPLEEMGFRDIEASWFDWITEYPSFESWWAFDAEFGPLKPLFDSLDENQAIAARHVMADSLSAYLTESGSYRLPARARTITARG